MAKSVLKRVRQWAGKREMNPRIQRRGTCELFGELTRSLEKRQTKQKV